MRVVVAGLGAVGTRAARQLASTDEVEQVIVTDLDEDRVSEVVSSLGAKSKGHPVAPEELPDADVVVLATPPGVQLGQARDLVGRGISVVSTSDAMADVRGLLDLDAEAEARKVADNVTFEGYLA